MNDNKDLNLTVSNYLEEHTVRITTLLISYAEESGMSVQVLISILQLFATNLTAQMLIDDQLGGVDDPELN